ncbi:Hypothetical predicted protein [Octopus vulgaris]|uniref:Uncharacterized protein n=1 Tax=Octopus vulgaris TaxID=6645 RepID=A0AA36B3A6_OCTVU|nr:Hypothetical predicted protein [Octopus vulgaris]
MKLISKYEIRNYERIEENNSQDSENEGKINAPMKSILNESEVYLSPLNNLIFAADSKTPAMFGIEVNGIPKHVHSDPAKQELEMNLTYSDQIWT